MTYRIHYTLPDGSNDSVVISASTVEELRELAQAAVASRNGANPWSEELA